jgi:hypothetical protein
MKQRIGFARWRSDLASGGNRYDDELAVALRALGLDVREYPVPGSWPVPKQQERERLSGLLAAEQDWLIDNSSARQTGGVSAAVEYGDGSRCYPLLPGRRSALSQRVEEAHRERGAGSRGRGHGRGDQSWAADRWPHVMGVAMP